MNCPDNGLIIGADDITLDLNGHTISGDGAPVESCPDGATCDVGIDDPAGHTGVEIKSGSTQGFDVGVLMRGARDTRLDGLSSANNSDFGVVLGDSKAIRVDHNSVSDGVGGILVFDSHNSRIDHNSVSSAHGYAIPLFGSSDNRLKGNVISGNDHGILLDSSDDNVVTQNRISHSGGSSIDIGHANGNRVEQNLLRDDGDGVILFEADRNEIRNNSVTGTGFFGFPYTGGFGIIFDGADGNVAQQNVVTGGRGPAIFVTSLDSPDRSDHNSVTNNVANSKLNDGILVNGNATATVLENNTTNENGHDGVEVDAAGTTVTRNTADDNHDLGIEGVPGVIDGGGNRASGNGNPSQCLIVVCR